MQSLEETQVHIPHIDAETNKTARRKAERLKGYIQAAIVTYLPQLHLAAVQLF